MGLKGLALEVVKRRQALEFVPDYIRYMRGEGLSDFEYEPAKHHLVLAKALREMADAEHEADRTAISLPPGSAKSFYSSIVFPTWLLARNPRFKILCVSAGESLAEDFARRRRSILLSKSWNLLSNSTLTPDARSLSFQGTDQGGGIYAVGAGSIIQGLRADVLIADDLVTGHEQAGNLSQLDKLWNWYSSEARPRLRGQSYYTQGLELLIATRWALLDPIGRVLRLNHEGEEKWRYIRIPMVCDSEDDLIGRKMGERLWPQYFTHRMVKDARRNPLFWDTLYQQRPAAAEFAWVDKSHVFVEREEPPLLKYYLGIDLAHSVAKGDFTVICVVGVDVHKNFWLVDVQRMRSDPQKSASVLCDLVDHYKPAYCWIENDNASVVWTRIARESADRRKIGLPLLLSRMRNKDKEERASALRSLFLQNRVRILQRDWTETVLREMAEFPAGRNDDIVDAFGVVAKEMHRISSPSIELTPQPKPIMGSVQEKDGLIVTTQPLDEIIKLSAGGRSRNKGRI